MVAKKMDGIHPFRWKWKTNKTKVEDLYRNLLIIHRKFLCNKIEKKYLFIYYKLKTKILLILCQTSHKKCYLTPVASLISKSRYIFIN